LLTQEAPGCAPRGNTENHAGDGDAAVSDRTPNKDGERVALPGDRDVHFSWLGAFPLGGHG